MKTSAALQEITFVVLSSIMLVVGCDHSRLTRQAKTLQTVHAAIWQFTERTGSLPTNLESVLDERIRKQMEEVGIDSSRLQYLPSPSDAHDDSPLITYDRGNMEIVITHGGSAMVRKKK